MASLMGVGGVCGRNIGSCCLGKGALCWPTAGVRGRVRQTEKLGARVVVFFWETPFSLLFLLIQIANGGGGVEVFKTKQDFYFFSFILSVFVECLFCVKLCFRALLPLFRGIGTSLSIPPLHIFPDAI